MISVNCKFFVISRYEVFKSILSSNPLMKTSLFGLALTTSFLFGLLCHASPDNDLNNSVGNGSSKTSSKIKDKSCSEEILGTQLRSVNFVKLHKSLSHKYEDDSPHKNKMFNFWPFRNKKSKSEDKFLNREAAQCLMELSRINKGYSEWQKGCEIIPIKDATLYSDQDNNTCPSRSITSSKNGVMDSCTSINEKPPLTGVKDLQLTTDHLRAYWKQGLNESVPKPQNTCLNSVHQEEHLEEFPPQSNERSSGSFKFPQNIYNRQIHKIHEPESSKNVIDRGTPNAVAPVISEKGDVRRTVFEPIISKNTNLNQPPASKRSVLNIKDKRRPHVAIPNNSNDFEKDYSKRPLPKYLTSEITNLNPSSTTQTTSVVKTRPVLIKKSVLKHADFHEQYQNKFKARGLQFIDFYEPFDFTDDYEDEANLFNLELRQLVDYVLCSFKKVKSSEVELRKAYYISFLE